MSGFNRGNYRATPMSAIKTQEEQHETKRPSGGKRTILEIKPGDNKFRIFPTHPEGGGATYSEAKCVSFLPIEVQAKDDRGKIIEGKTMIQRKPIFNSKVHGDLPKDLVEEYLKIAKDTAIPNFTDDMDKAEAVWKYLTGQFGVKPQDSWVVYATKWGGTDWGPEGLLEFKKMVSGQLRDKAAEFIGEEDDPATPDPYTDPDHGIAVIIKKTGEKLTTEYTVRMEQKSGSYVKTPLTDEQLQRFSALDPLHKMFVKAFKLKDFEYQLEGLKRFEDELLTKKIKLKSGEEFTPSISVFECEEFQQAIDEIMSMLPQTEGGESEGPQDDAEEEEVITPEPIKVSQKAARPVQQVVEKKKAPAVVTKPVAAKPTPVPIKKVVKQVIQEEEQQEEEEQQQEEQPIVTTTTTGSVADRLASIRNKHKFSGGGK